MSYNPIKDVLDKRGEAIVTIKIDEDIIIKKQALRTILYYLKQYQYTNDDEELQYIINTIGQELQ